LGTAPRRGFYRFPRAGGNRLRRRVDTICSELVESDRYALRLLRGIEPFKFLCIEMAGEACQLVIDPAEKTRAVSSYTPTKRV
ncbi:MAG: hypothetical protein AAB339_00855, partial [Elusimicrobiota bacterium]